MNNYMKNPCLHIAEKRYPGDGLTLRCCEPDGGCGQRVDLQALRVSQGLKVYPGYIEFYRQHLRCGDAAEPEGA